MPGMTIATGRTLLGSRSSRYLLLDRFLTDDPASLATPRVCEPGPGALTINQPANMSISGGLLIGAAGVGDKGAQSVDAYLHAAGRAYGAQVVNITNRLDLLTGPTPGEYDIEIINAASVLFVRGPFGALNTGPFTPTLPLTTWLIRRASGGLFYTVAGKLRWVHNATDTTSWRIKVNGAANSSAFEISSLKIAAGFGGPWRDDYGIATSHVAAPVSGESAVSTADAMIEFTWTPVAAETLELDVRRTDSDNRWVVRCSQSGSTIKLIERNAGSETERDSDAQTWTAGTPYRIVVAMEGADIRNWVNDTAQNAYTSASFNQSATGVRVAGFTTGSNLVCWPRDVSALIPTNI